MKGLFVGVCLVLAEMVQSVGPVPSPALTVRTSAEPEIPALVATEDIPAGTPFFTDAAILKSIKRVTVASSNIGGFGGPKFLARLRGLVLNKRVSRGSIIGYEDLAETDYAESLPGPMRGRGRCGMPHYMPMTKRAEGIAMAVKRSAAVQSYCEKQGIAIDVRRGELQYLILADGSHCFYLWGNDRVDPALKSAWSNEAPSIVVTIDAVIGQGDKVEIRGIRHTR